MIKMTGSSILRKKLSIILYPWSAEQLALADGWGEPTHETEPAQTQETA
jgi:hypothetical protein